MLNENISVNVDLHARVNDAFHALMETSQHNQQSIIERRARIADIRNYLRVTLEELKQQQLEVHAIDALEIENVRERVTKYDCQSLKAHIDNISNFIASGQTEKAIDLLEPMALNTSLLRLRLQYIKELEGLLQDYENEKQFRTKINMIAQYLGVASDTLSLDDNKSEDKQKTIALTTDRINMDEEVIAESVLYLMEAGSADAY